MTPSHKELIFFTIKVQTSKYRLSLIKTLPKIGQKDSQLIVETGYNFGFSKNLNGFWRQIMFTSPRGLNRQILTITSNLVEERTNFVCDCSRDGRLQMIEFVCRVKNSCCKPQIIERVWIFSNHLPTIDRSYSEN